MNNDCLFCKIVSGKTPCDKVYEDNDVMAFRDIDPKAPVHIIIIPKRHFSTILDCQDKDILGKLIIVSSKLARSEDISESGFRLIINCNKDGGQAVYHIHLHLLGGRKFSWPPG